jgi:hypothetical protein
MVTFVPPEQVVNPATHPVMDVEPGFCVTSEIIQGGEFSYEDDRTKQKDSGHGHGLGTADYVCRADRGR